MDISVVVDDEDASVPVIVEGGVHKLSLFVVTAVLWKRAA